MFCCALPGCLVLFFLNRLSLVLHVLVYHYLNIGDFVPRFADMNVKDVKDARTVGSDDEAPFGPD